MKSGLISIIIPVYNAENSIKETLNSVLSQSYSNWELIVVDDCSKDKSVTTINDVLSEVYKKAKIISLSENKGVANARNIGLDTATGEFVAFLDSDDTWDSKKLEKQISFMRERNCYLSFTAYKKMNEEGMVRSTISVRDSVSYNGLLFGNIIACSSAMFYRETLLKYRFLAVGHEDFAFWLSALKTIPKAYGLDQPLMFYRVSSNSISANKIKAAKYTWNIYRKIEKFSIIKSAFFFISYSLRGLKKYLK